MCQEGKGWGSSTHKMWAREGGKRNHKAEAEGDSRSQKLLPPLESEAELFRGLVAAELNWRKPGRLLAVHLWSMQQCHCSNGMSTWAEVSEQGPAGISG